MQTGERAAIQSDERGPWERFERLGLLSTSKNVINQETYRLHGILRKHIEKDTA